MLQRDDADPPGPLGCHHWLPLGKVISYPSPFLGMMIDAIRFDPPSQTTPT